MSFGLFCGQAAALYAVWSEQIGLATFLYGHIVLCSAPLILAFGSRGRPAVFALYLQLALWTAIAGPLGILIAIFVAAFGQSRLPASQDFGAWIDGQVATWHSRTRALRSALLDGRLRIEGASRVVPLLTVFCGGSQKEKFSALTVIVQRFEPSFSRALRLAAQDSDPSVRILASTVIAKLQAKAGARLVALKEAAAASDGAPEAWLALANAHAEYADSGLLSPYQAREHVGHAITCIERALALSPESDPIRTRHAELISQSERYAKTDDSQDIVNERPIATSVELKAEEGAAPRLRQGPELTSGAST